MKARVNGRFGGTLMGLLVGISFSLPAAPAAATAPAAAAVAVPDVTAANWYWGPANRRSWHNTRRILPTAQVGRGNGPVAAPTSWPGHRHGTYRSFWWLSDSSCGRFAGVGLGGHLLVVDPVADMVVVKFDSVPAAELDDKAFDTEYQGIDAIIHAVSGHGCS